MDIFLPEDPTRKAQCSSTDYDFCEHIGTGSYGSVKKAMRNGNIYAIKTHKNIDSYVGDQIKFRFVNELLMLSSGALLGGVDSPYIIEMYDWFQEDDGSVHIVMPYCPMDMHTLMNRFLLTEHDIQFYMAQIICGLESIHDAHLIHNDLKPENILLDEDGHVRITDFGVSELCGPNELKRGQYGTQIYMAPETLNFRGHNQMADYFSLGVLLYELLNGELAYYGKTTAEVIKSQKRKLKFHESVTMEARDLIRGLLQKSVSKRAEFVSRIREHPFFDGIDWFEIENKLCQPPYNPTRGEWRGELGDCIASGIGAQNRKRSPSKRNYILKLAARFVATKKSKNCKNHPSGAAQSDKCQTDKIPRKKFSPAKRLLYHSLTRFTSSSNRSSVSDRP